VPQGLINFGLDHGRGQISESINWICDPATYSPPVTGQAEMIRLLYDHSSATRIADTLRNGRRKLMA